MVIGVNGNFKLLVCGENAPYGSGLTMTFL